MTERITHVAFNMHRDSITAAWLLPSETSPEVRTIPHEVKPFRRLVRQILAHGPARASSAAMARPIPWAAPVTMATRPSSPPDAMTAAPPTPVLSPS